MASKAYNYFELIPLNLTPLITLMQIIHGGCQCHHFGQNVLQPTLLLLFCTLIVGIN